MTRRTFLPTLAGAAALTQTLPAHAQAPPAQTRPPQRTGRLKQCVTKGVFKGRTMTLDEMAREAAQRGIYGFDLIGPADWPVLRQHGLVPTMLPGPYGGTIPDALNRKENHARLDRSLREGIDLAAAGNCPNVITFSGNRRGMSDAEGADNCVLFLKNIKSYAESKSINICMELLNSKVNHKDYMCDHAAWGVDVMKRVNSPRVKLLYDIYHMQIMDGDIVRTIRENIQHIGHFHTGGNPGRHEIDGTQELNYRFIAQSIADLGFTGCIAHEYTPVRDPLTSLDQAIEICTV